jgi:hypothetical protein
MKLPLTMTDADLHTLLRQKAKDMGGQKVLAEWLGISRPMLSMILVQERRVSEAALRKLGLKRIELLVPAMENVDEGEG